jgi:hypothetical protein
MIPFSEVALLLRGWAESEAPLRVIVRSPEIVFSAFCTAFKAESGRVAFWIESKEDNNAIDFLVADCVFDFRDSPPEEEGLTVGGEVESTIAAVRNNFELLIFLLKQPSSVR